MAEEYEEEMNGEEDTGVTGPGAPTPVSALEVSTPVVPYRRWASPSLPNAVHVGTCWPHKARLSTPHGWRLPNRRVRCLRTQAHAGTGQGHIRTESYQNTC